MLKGDPKASWANDDASSDEEGDRRVRADTAQSEDDHPVATSAPSDAPATGAAEETTHARREFRKERRPRPERLPVPDQPPFTAYVGNLPYTSEERDIAELFGALEISSISLPKPDGKSKGFAYVEFKTKHDLEEALKISGQQLQDRPLHIDVAARERTRRKNNRGGDKERGFGSGFRRRDPEQPGDAEQKSESTPAVRTKLAIQPRSKPLDTDAEIAARNSTIFGTGKPREIQTGAEPADVTSAQAKSTTAPRGDRGAPRGRGGRGDRAPGDRSTGRGTGRGERSDRKKPQSQADTEKKRERKERRKPDSELTEEEQTEKFQRQLEANQKREAEDRERESKNSSARATNVYAALDDSDEEEN